MEQDSVARFVGEVLLGDPSLHKCLEMGVVNHSKVASRLKPVVSELVGRNVSEESIKMALIRLHSKMGEKPVFPSKGVLKSAVAKMSSKARFLAVMQSGPVTTIVLDEESAKELVEVLGEEGVIEVQKDHAAIVVVSPPEVMWVPGVVAYITSVLAQNGVNVVHIESCYTDTVIVVSKKDLLKAFNALVKHNELAKALLEKSK